MHLVRRVVVVLVRLAPPSTCVPSLLLDVSLKVEYSRRDTLVRLYPMANNKETTL